jgi:hypothetical protein
VRVRGSLNSPARQVRGRTSAKRLVRMNCFIELESSFLGVALSKALFVPLVYSKNTTYITHNRYLHHAKPTIPVSPIILLIRGDPIRGVQEYSRGSGGYIRVQRIAVFHVCVTRRRICLEDQSRGRGSCRVSPACYSTPSTRSCQHQPRGFGFLLYSNHTSLIYIVQLSYNIIVRHPCVHC